MREKNFLIAGFMLLSFAGSNRPSVFRGHGWRDRCPALLGISRYFSRPQFYRTLVPRGIEVDAGTKSQETVLPEGHGLVFNGTGRGALPRFTAHHVNR